MIQRDRRWSLRRCQQIQRAVAATPDRGRKSLFMATGGIVASLLNRPANGCHPCRDQENHSFLRDRKTLLFGGFSKSLPALSVNSAWPAGSHRRCDSETVSHQRQEAGLVCPSSGLPRAASANAQPTDCRVKWAGIQPRRCSIYRIGLSRPHRHWRSKSDRQWDTMTLCDVEESSYSSAERAYRPAAALCQLPRFWNWLLTLWNN